MPRMPRISSEMTVTVRSCRMSATTPHTRCPAAGPVVASSAASGMASATSGAAEHGRRRGIALRTSSLLVKRRDGHVDEACRRSAAPSTSAKCSSSTGNPAAERAQYGRGTMRCRVHALLRQGVRGTPGSCSAAGLMSMPASISTQAWPLGLDGADQNVFGLCGRRRSACRRSV